MSNCARILRAPDYAKALGIFLVVFGHVLRGLMRSSILLPSPFWIAVDRGIYLFHMPLFFYLSGLFFSEIVQRYGYVALLKRNAAILLLPLAVWSYLQFSIQFAFKADANVKLSWFDVLTAPFPPRQQFWFLAVLFMAMVIVGGVLALRKSAMLLWVVMAGFFAVRIFADGFVQQLLAANYYTSLAGQLIIHLPFFIAGVLIGTEFLVKFQVNTGVCLALIALALWVEQSTPVAGSFVSVVAALLCVLGLYSCFLNIDGRTNKGSESLVARIFVFIGMNSMIIYVAHVICAAGFRSVLIKIGVFNSSVHLWGGVLVGVFAPLLLVPAALKMRKHCPIITDIVFPVRLTRKMKQLDRV